MKGTAVTESEAIVSYAFHSTDMKADCPAYNTFMPNKELKRSVCRVDGLGHPGIVEIGKVHVEPARGEVKGYGAGLASAVLSLGLSFDPDGIPHNRHANVTGWSGDRAADRILAKKIADECALLRYADL